MKPVRTRNGAAVVSAPGTTAAAGDPPHAPAAAVSITKMRRCTCSCTRILHRGPRGDGACIRCASCKAYREANRG